MCKWRLWHSWSEWERYEEPITLFFMGRRDLDIPPRQLERMSLRQKRMCRACGKLQDELVKVYRMLGTEDREGTW